MIQGEADAEVLVPSVVRGQSPGVGVRERFLVSGRSAARPQVARGPRAARSPTGVVAVSNGIGDPAVRAPITGVPPPSDGSG